MRTFGWRAFLGAFLFGFLGLTGLARFLGRPLILALGTSSVFAAAIWVPLTEEFSKMFPVILILVLAVVASPPNESQSVGEGTPPAGDASPSEPLPSGDAQPTGGPTPSSGTPTTITAPDGTVTAVGPDGSINVSSPLPPSGNGLTTGAGAPDPNDPQQGQQPIGFTHQVLGSSSPSDPATSISDMPNTAHVQGASTPGANPPGTTPPGTTPPGTTPAGTTPHKPNTP